MGQLHEQPSQALPLEGKVISSDHPLIDGLQQLYEAHRTPESWESCPSVSTEFFNTWLKLNKRAKTEIEPAIIQL